MTGKKNTTAPAETAVKTAAVAEAPAAEKKAAPAAEKKATAAKKPAAKKTAEKKAAAPKKTAAKKAAAPKKTAAKKAAETVYIQYNGAEVTPAILIERAKAESGIKSPAKVDVYVKPEENMVYYVVDNNPGSFYLS